ncbi:uncharacterized protein N7496_001155 [Penicillium cataractarum]|uniref:Uncharacterized protein n=1 Tax=Penicillium cataractarum TaxID=2100454 RepID=A0A9W9VVC5_9EURO|nr:uncharacterized protein N7496_001155 [Penicillium cataractarum]KAJ5390087.1 hypothetical protein N7496_001155 [Penicillium cataractarum]
MTIESRSMYSDKLPDQIVNVGELGADSEVAVRGNEYTASSTKKALWTTTGRYASAVLVEDWESEWALLCFTEKILNDAGLRTPVTCSQGFPCVQYGPG